MIKSSERKGVKREIGLLVFFFLINFISAIPLLQEIPWSMFLTLEIEIWNLHNKVLLFNPILFLSLSSLLCFSRGYILCMYCMLLNRLDFASRCSSHVRVKWRSLKHIQLEADYWYWFTWWPFYVTS